MRNNIKLCSIFFVSHLILQWQWQCARDFSPVSIRLLFYIICIAIYICQRYLISKNDRTHVVKFCLSHTTVWHATAVRLTLSLSFSARAVCTHVYEALYCTSLACEQARDTLSAANRILAVRQFETIVKIQRTSLFNDRIEGINFNVEPVHKDKVYTHTHKLNRASNSERIHLHVCALVCKMFFLVPVVGLLRCRKHDVYFI